MMTLACWLAISVPAKPLHWNQRREEGFDAGVLNGRDYNTVYLATRFSESSTPTQVEAGSGSWQISAILGTSSITQAQTFATLSRDSSGAVSVDNMGNRSDNWIISPR